MFAVTSPEAIKMQPWNVPHQAAGAPEPKVNPDKVTVYNMRFCPYAQRTILTLLAKQIPFDVVNINLKSKPEWFLQNTWGTVSVVRYKGQYVMESLINSDFIDEQFPNYQLHPADPMEKAKGRLRVEKFTKLTTQFYKIVYMPSTAEERQGHWATLVGKLGEIDAELKMLGTPFFGGQTPNMTDFMIWPWIERLPCMSLCWPGEKFDVPSSLAQYNGWVEKMREVPAVKQYAVTTDQHFQFRQEMMTKTKDWNYDFLL